MSHSHSCLRFHQPILPIRHLLPGSSPGGLDVGTNARGKCGSAERHNHSAPRGCPHGSRTPPRAYFPSQAVLNAAVATTSDQPSLRVPMRSELDQRGPASPDGTDAGGRSSRPPDSSAPRHTPSDAATGNPLRHMRYLFDWPLSQEGQLWPRIHSAGALVIASPISRSSP